MAAARAKDDGPLAPIKDAVRAGKLTEIREWIQSGKPLVYPAGDKRYSVLEVAARTGFYAVVEELLKVWTDKSALTRALDRALQARHTQVATLLVKHGADVNRHWLSTIAEYNDPDLMRAFLDRSGDVTKENDLAHAIAVGARPLARVFKEYCAKIPGGNIQLAMALRHFASKQSLRWVSLCAWMGADPRLRVPDLDPPHEEPSTALEDAFYDPTMALIKPLHVDPKRDDVNHLLSKIQYFNREVVEHLLALGAKLNDKPNGGCSLLEKCFENLAFDVRASVGIGLNRASEDDIHVLLKHGARFMPDDYWGYRGIREAIAGLDSHRRPEFLKLLATATTPEILMKIVSTPSMQKKLGITPKRLMEELGLQPSAEPLHAKAKPERRKPPQVAARPKEKAMDSPPVKADTPSVPKPAQASEPARAASSRARDEALERAAKLRKEAIARGPVTLTRQELYNAVWSQAMWTLAPSFGLSDVWLAKICRKHDIPHPPLGYWAKKEQGKAPRQPSLPNPEEEGGKRIWSYYPHWFVRYRDADGIMRRPSTGCRDDKAAKQILAKIVSEVEKVKSGIISRDEAHAGHHAKAPMSKHVEDYATHLRACERNTDHIQNTRRAVMRVVNDCAFGRLRDLQRAKAERWLLKQADLGMCARTRNTYRIALVAFGNWCVRESRLLANPFAMLPRANEAVDRRRVRRALTLEEVGKLLKAAEERPLRERMLITRGKHKGELRAKVREQTKRAMLRLGRERAMFYRIAVYTGLRVGEIASLTLADVCLDAVPPHIKLHARHDKARRGARQPLPDDLARAIREFLDTRLKESQEDALQQGVPAPAVLDPTMPLISDPPVRTFYRDLAAAGIAKKDRRDLNPRPPDPHSAELACITLGGTMSYDFRGRLY
jgi:integrase